MIWKNLEVKKQFIRYLQCRIRKAESLGNLTLYAGINKNTKQPLKAVSFTNAIQ